MRIRIIELMLPQATFVESECSDVADDIYEVSKKIHIQVIDSHTVMIVEEQEDGFKFSEMISPSCACNKILEMDFRKKKEKKHAC